jgi:hypothetical protein
MQPRDVFGLFVRAVGLLLVIWGAVCGFLYHPAALVMSAIGLFLLGGAEVVVRFAYRGRE